MKARIMLVEDEPDIREEIAEYLGFCGYDVTTAADGKEALSQLTAQPVDLVIADELMPNLTGLQLLAKLRAMDQLRDMPVIIVSAWMADRCESEQPAPQARLLKPFELAELDSLVGRLLGRLGHAA